MVIEEHGHESVEKMKDWVCKADVVVVVVVVVVAVVVFVAVFCGGEGSKKKS